MKITFIAEIDFANVLTEYSYCLNKHSDIQSRTVCIRPHGFNYKIQHDYDLSKINETELNEVYNWITTSDVIIFGEESAGMYQILQHISTIINYDILSSGKKLIIWHPGSNYRNSSTYYNNHPLRDKIYKHLYAIDLYRLSPQTEEDIPLHTYQYYNFDYETYINNFKSKLIGPRTILHIPSNTNIKGTSLINKCISECNLDNKKFIYKTLHKVPYSEVIYEKEQSIFYIDQINSLGGYGVASIEALYRSNLTFCTTHNISQSMLKLTSRYESPVVTLTENINDNIQTLNKFFKMNDLELIDTMEAIGKWVEEQYNPISVVNFFKNKIL